LSSSLFACLRLKIIPFKSRIFLRTFGLLRLRVLTHERNRVESSPVRLKRTGQRLFALLTVAACGNAYTPTESRRVPRALPGQETWYRKFRQLESSDGRGAGADLDFVGLKLVQCLGPLRKRIQNYGYKTRYRGADKSLARPGRKQTTATEDFDVHISYLLA
jgi:hypothetical protein